MKSPESQPEFDEGPDGKPNEDQVEALVFETLERWEREGSSAIESAVSKHPEFEVELRARLHALQALGLVEVPPEAPLAVPERVGSYILGDPIGEGGMGLVFEAQDPAIQRTVAIKLIRPQYVTRASMRARFAREGRAIARLQHPSVARVYQVGEEEGLPFIAMERVFGCTVAEVLKEVRSASQERGGKVRTGRDFQQVVQRLSGGEPSRLGTEFYAGSWAQVVMKICREVAEGLAHAHGAGVLHRDVKSSNIMVTPEGRVLLIDFGLAQLDASATMTAPGSRLGSLPYTAPERIAPGSPPTASGDVYSLGVVMVEMLTLELPFQASSEAGLIGLIVEGNSAHIGREIHRTQPGVRAIFVEVSERAMRRDPARRPPSAAALADDLSRVLAGKAPVARGDHALAILRSLWRARPWITAASMAAILLAIVLPTAVLSLQARAAERVAESGEVSLRRLQLAMDATGSLKAILPDSPALAGTPLGALRASVLRDLASIEGEVENAREAGLGLDWSPLSTNGDPVEESPDRALVQEARRIAKQGFRNAQGLGGAGGTDTADIDTADIDSAGIDPTDIDPTGTDTGSASPATQQHAVRVVEQLEAIRTETSRSLEVEAALIELMHCLAVHALEQGDRYESEGWRKRALEHCATLRRVLPESTWLAARSLALNELGESATR